ncbi:MAG: hypothetical protein ACKV22_13455 [Bryobacteraceae bacterium]
MRIAACFGLALAGLMLLPPPLQAGDSGSRAAYVGGTVAGLPSKTEGTLTINDPEAMSFRLKSGTIRVLYSRVNTLEYGQTVGRRYVSAILISPLLLLAKKRRHYLTVGFTDDEGQQQAMVFEVEKGQIRAVLAGLEARTGRRVEFQDEEARKSGKG